MMQRKITLVNIAEAMARQWYGYVVYPEDWKHQWVISGLVSNVAQKVVNDVSESDSEFMVFKLLHTKKQPKNNVQTMVKPGIFQPYN